MKGGEKLPSPFLYTLCSLLMLHSCARISLSLPFLTSTIKTTLVNVPKCNLIKHCHELPEVTFLRLLTSKYPLWPSIVIFHLWTKTKTNLIIQFK